LMKGQIILLFQLLFFLFKLKRFIADKSKLENVSFQKVIRCRFTRFLYDLNSGRNGIGSRREFEDGW